MEDTNNWETPNRSRIEKSAGYINHHWISIESIASAPINRQLPGF